tara:strand:+ start:215 stop:517 length:303 start_codon:yes stop_codon:yes gene_type:complete
MTKKKSYKPSNKDRDTAIAHILGKTTTLEQMIEGLAKTFDEFLAWKGWKEDFLKFFNDKLKKDIEEGYNEEREAQEGNEATLDKDSDDEGRGSEGVREGE